MRSFQLEVWVHQIVERVTSSSPVEDARVELKAEWIEPIKAARRLAAHANGARGEPILWVIGVDEKAAKVSGAQGEEVANWLPRVQRQFDLVHPELLQHLVVPIQVGVAVVALLFDTQQAPYVVKNPAHGTGPDAVALEVPWRDGARTRSARRSELLRILASLQLLPEIDLMEAELRVRRETTYDPQLGEQEILTWNLIAAAYFAPPRDRDVVLPFHRAHAVVAFEGSELMLPFDAVRIGPEMEGQYSQIFTGALGSAPPKEPKVVVSEWVLRSPARLLVTGHVRTEQIDDLPSQGAEVTARLGVAGSQQEMMIKWNLDLTSDESALYTERWAFTPG